MIRRLVLAAFLTLPAACGGGNGDGTGSRADGSFAIASPEDEAEVSTPFTIEFSSEVELGPIDTGAHHVHVFFDGNESNYEVVESDTFEVSDLSSGEHTITASLRNADHSPADAEAEITVEVTGGGGGGGGDDNGGYGY